MLPKTTPVSHLKNPLIVRDVVCVCGREGEDKNTWKNALQRGKIELKIAQEIMCYHTGGSLCFWEETLDVSMCVHLQNGHRRYRHWIRTGVWRKNVKLQTTTFTEKLSNVALCECAKLTLYRAKNQLPKNCFYSFEIGNFIKRTHPDPIRSVTNSNGRRNISRNFNGRY